MVNIIVVVKRIHIQIVKTAMVKVVIDQSIWVLLLTSTSCVLGYFEGICSADPSCWTQICTSLLDRWPWLLVTELACGYVINFTAIRSCIEEVQPRFGSTRWVIDTTISSVPDVQVEYTLVCACVRAWLRTSASTCACQVDGGGWSVSKSVSLVRLSGSHCFPRLEHTAMACPACVLILLTLRSVHSIKQDLSAK